MISSFLALFISGCTPPLNFRHSLTLCSPEPSRIKDIAIYYDDVRLNFPHRPSHTTPPKHERCGLGAIDIGLSIPKKLTVTWKTINDNKSHSQSINIDRSMLTMKSLMTWQIRIDESHLELWRQTYSDEASLFRGKRIIENIFP